MKIVDTSGPDIELGLSEDVLAAIILEAKAFDVLVPESDPDEGSNDADDREISVLEDQADNPALQILKASIDGLSIEQQETLIALTWLGRGDYDASEWQQALEMAAERDTGSASAYLSGMPLMGDYLEAGLAALGVNLGASETRAMSHFEQDGETDRD